MNNLVIMKNKQAVTTSLQVAETFGKRHDHVLRDIEHVRKDLPNFGEMFIEANVPDSYGRDRKAYYLNRDGFTLLVMGFTGSEALNFKLQYIQAFNEMEQIIANKSKDSYMIDDRVQRATRWIDEERERERLAKENRRLQMPALLGTAVSTSTDVIHIGSFANVLKQNGVDIGQNRFFSWLRDHGYLVKGGKRHNMPTQKSLDLGIMKVRGTVITTNHGSANRFTPLITGKGQQYFIGKFLKPSDLLKEVME
ncbi:MAG: phage regulatory protein/antirepressor Ant [Lentilactobacillus buchneri]|jgi:anti-repressor protein|nr:phage regulatory protein/antirepressor Ant [Lentilactobacillus buchneri]